ncbi:unnamed protein product [Vitrella brassicaformis CCMP3155]|uniref:ABC transporter domain-containing protein n=2 Tax=Vitrella brassicaformis TaxID=1169539 RepID=A0A0G4FI88_VITBC|nr:unnamed protein product [Vitrella brassicaformis CCMP3155]|eukprot:CEM13183.1 unnamed protein product [Vitrella brassicaformis CCMP3155]
MQRRNTKNGAADRQPLLDDGSGRQRGAKKLCEASAPEQEASFLGRLFISWVGPYLAAQSASLRWAKTSKGDDTTEVVPHLSDCDAPFLWADRLEHQLSREQARAEEKGRRPRVLPVLMRTFWVPLLQCLALRVLNDACGLMYIYKLKNVVGFAESAQGHTNAELLNEFGSRLMLLVLSLLKILTHVHFDFMTWRLYLRLSQSLITTIFHRGLDTTGKASNRPTDEREGTGTDGKGERASLYTLITNDLDPLQWLTDGALTCLLLPLKLGFSFWLLSREGGGRSSTIAPLVTVLAMIVIVFILCAISAALRKPMMLSKDKRTELWNEALTEIRTLRIINFMEPVIVRIRKVRIPEVSATTARLACNRLAWFCEGIMVSMALYVFFATYVLEQAQEGKPFGVSSSMLITVQQIMQEVGGALGWLPFILKYAFEASVSLQRLQDFLALSHAPAAGATPLTTPVVIGPSPVSSPSLSHVDSGGSFAQSSHIDDADVLCARKATFSWRGDGSTEGFRLKDISLRLQRNEIVVLLGARGAGKSSLLSALLGDMKLLRGTVDTYPSGGVLAARASSSSAAEQLTIGWSTQVPWIPQGEVRSTILFGRDYDQKAYDRVVEACQLCLDIDAWPHGDVTEVNEGGHVLSGGQRQRLTLARALYNPSNDTDLFLLDDPFASLDPRPITFQTLLSESMQPQGSDAGAAAAAVSLPVRVVLMYRGRVAWEGKVDEVAQQLSLADPSHPLTALFSGRVASLPSEAAAAAAADSERAEEASHAALTRIGGGLPMSEGRGEPSTPLTPRSVPSSIEERHSMLQCVAVNDWEQPWEAVQDMGGYRGVGETGQNQRTGALFEEEKTKQGSVSLSTYAWYVQHAGVLLAVLIGLAVVGKEIGREGGKIYFKRWTEKGETDVLTQVACLRTYMIFLLALIGWGLVECLGETIGSMKASSSIHNKLVKSLLLRVPLRWFDANPLGRVLTRIAGDMWKVDDQLMAYFGIVLGSSARLLFTAGMLLYTAPVAFLFVPVIYVPFLVYVAWPNQEAQREMERKKMQCLSKVFSHFNQTMAGAPIIRAFKQQGAFIGENLRHINMYGRRRLVSYSAFQWMKLRLQLLGFALFTITTLGPLLGLAVRGPRATPLSGEELRGNATLFGLSLQYAMDLRDLIGGFLFFIIMLEINFVSVERIQEYVKLDPEESSTPSARRTRRRQQQQREARAALPPRPGAPALVLDKVEVRYRAGVPPALRDISLSLAPGEHVGVVGRTGAGKSTLLLSVLRQVELSHGRLLIAGREAQDMADDEFRRVVGVLPQFPVVLKDWTVRELLDPEDYFNDATIWEALDLCGLGPTLTALYSPPAPLPNSPAPLRDSSGACPDDSDDVTIPILPKEDARTRPGLDLVVAPSGGMTARRDEGTDGGDTNGASNSLSVGQLQQLAVARLLLQAKAPGANLQLLVIDEPPPPEHEGAGSAADDSGAPPLHVTLRKVLPHCAALIVAHHAASIRGCDRVLVMHKGRITRQLVPSDGTLGSQEALGKLLDEAAAS